MHRWLLVSIFAFIIKVFFMLYFETNGFPKRLSSVTLLLHSYFHLNFKCYGWNPEIQEIAGLVLEAWLIKGWHIFNEQEIWTLHPTCGRHFYTYPIFHLFLWPPSTTPFSFTSHTPMAGKGVLDSPTLLVGLAIVLLFLFFFLAV
jgi:hypothetical protein